jgi:Protein of unknown function (DUF3489)
MTKQRMSAERAVAARTVATKSTAAGRTDIKPSSPKVTPKTKNAAVPKAAVLRPKADAVASSRTAIVSAAIATETSRVMPKSTKQEQVLIMLSKAGGARINEIMKATGWQQHSVRGFFAGTVRKKLGFELTSEKPEGEERWYAIKVAG